MKREFATDLLDYIYKSPTSFNAVKTSEDLLIANGFTELKMNKKWDLQVGGKYYLTKNSSALAAFVINSDNIENEGFRIIGSHSDSPTFRIKPNPEMCAENTYLKLNTEGYGGAILSTWYDRPLAIAGRIIIKTEDILYPKEEIININKPICIIPSLAIHMNRSVNDGYKFNKQKDTLPLVGLINETLEKDDFLLNEISKNLEIDKKDILDFDLFLYEFEKGCLMGPNEEFISTGRMDNLSMAHASLHGLLDAQGQKGINIAVIFDNEEVGSSTKQGADSNMLLNLLERICLCLGKNREEFFTSLYSSFMISADLAHAVHPNINEKHDPTNRPVLGQGPVIKISASQSYTSDSFSVAVYKNICEKAGVKYQQFVNRSDERGGSTIGPISSTHLDIASVDIGSPILAMHSIRELGAVEDHFNIYKTFVEFYQI